MYILFYLQYLFINIDVTLTFDTNQLRGHTKNAICAISAHTASSRISGQSSHCLRNFLRRLCHGHTRVDSDTHYYLKSVLIALCFATILVFMLC